MLFLIAKTTHLLIHEILKFFYEIVIREMFRFRRRIHYNVIYQP